jgi:glycerol-3-phosphate cytidylyltransferase
MNKIALIVGGSNGIGLAISKELLSKGYKTIYIVDRESPGELFDKTRVKFKRLNLLIDDYSFLNTMKDIDTLIITAGFGRIAPFQKLTEIEIISSFKVNVIASARIIHHYFSKLIDKKAFYCAILGSISGLISSPLFSIYGASKAALCKFIESINIELEKSGTKNRILNVCPGNINGTRFYGGENDLEKLKSLAFKAIEYMFKRYTLFIPDYERIYKNVIAQYNNNSHQFGISSYNYKLESGRMSNTPQIKIGYLSGTFDLFHIGHLNLLRRAKEYCDYLVVGVHKNGLHKGKATFIPFEERKEILKSIKYVDVVIEALKEDSDVYDMLKYHYLFVGSDYKGSERFLRYESFFRDTEVEILYFPYTKETNSTQLRKALSSISQTK